MKIFGSKDDGGTQFNADCIFCTIVIVDWIVSDFLAIRQGSLGRLRYILKNGLKYLPLYGFYFAQVAVFWQKSFSVAILVISVFLLLLVLCILHHWMMCSYKSLLYNSILSYFSFDFRN